MTADIKSRAEERLARAAAAGGFADPRPPLRERLRGLKETHAAAFADALGHYEAEVLPTLAGSGDALAVWIDYGTWLAALSGPGRVLRIDAQGGAAPYGGPVEPGSLVLHVPDENAAGVLVLVAPAAPSAAQLATLDLLVHRKLSL